MGPRLLILLAAAIGFPYGAAAEALDLTYEIGIEPGAPTIPISLTLEGIESDSLRIQLTADYGGIEDYYRAVRDLRADGKPVDGPHS